MFNTKIDCSIQIGIYKVHDFCLGRYEYAPYSEDAKRSVYHTREFDIFRLKQLSNDIDIMFSHEWPRGVERHGDINKLLEKKPHFV